MRVCVNLTTTGQFQECLNITTFLRTLYDAFCALPKLNSELKNKRAVMETSLQKVENVCFHIKVRGKEATSLLPDVMVE